MAAKFNKPVANPEQPQGRVAARLREIASDSDIQSNAELKRRANYAGSTLSEAMGGRRRQSRDVISAIVRACISDSAAADAEIEALVAILEASPGPGQAPPVRELPPRPEGDDNDDDEGDDDEGEGSDGGEGSGGGEGAAEGNAVEPQPPERAGRVRAVARWVRTPVHGLSVLAVVVVVVVVVLVGVLVPRGGGSTPGPPPVPPQGQAPGQAPFVGSCVAPSVVRGGQCVGEVTDPDAIPAEYGLGPVLGKINQENNTAAATNSLGAPLATVAYFLPLPPSPSSFSSEMGNELEGLWRAQHRFNTDPRSGSLPKIRVEVFNTGRDGIDYTDVTPTVDREIAAGNRIVAATGLGQSVDATRSLVDYLSSRNILTVPARLTSDVLTTVGAAPGSALPTPPVGLLRVAPPNSQLAAAAARELLRTGTGAGTVGLVEDRRSGDNYNLNLAQTFQTEVARHPGTTTLLPALSYNSGNNDDALSTIFNKDSSVPALCRAHPQAVYVAGRGVDVIKFLISLDASPDCQGPPITVLTGDDGVDVLNQLRWARSPGLPPYPGGLPVRDLDRDNDALLAAFAHGKFVFRYTALTHPDLIPANDPAATDSVASFPDRDLIPIDEGATLMGYDAAVVTMQCIRDAADPSTMQSLVAPPATVLQTCRQHPTIPGVTGPLVFDSFGQAVDRPVPMIEVAGDGTATVVATYRPPYDH